MPLPDVIVDVQAGATPATVPTNTGQCFAVGVTQRGPINGPGLCRSLQDVVAFFGGRIPSSVFYDWCETYFAEGGTLLYVGRVFGSGALQATLNLMDNASVISLVVKAASLGAADPGTWANGAAGGLQVAVLVTAGTFQLQTSLGGAVVETSPALTTQADAVAWTTTRSRYIIASLGASALPPQAAAAANLAGGTDGASVADADYQAALDRIPKLLGPGQIAAPGRTSAAGGLQVLDHAQKNNRWACLDAVDTPSAVTVQTQAAALYGAPNNGRRSGQMNWPWEIIPGLTAYTTRTVPPSARQAAQYAKTDALGNPNTAAAGKNGKATFVIDLSQPALIDSDRLLLNTAGVVVSRRRYAGAIVTYGVRSLADEVLDEQWKLAPACRTVMAYVARAQVAADAYEFSNIDAQGRVQAAFKGDLIAPANDLFVAGALYGASPADAFYVDTGPGVNTLAQIQQGILAANVKLRVSDTNQQVQIHIVKTPISQSV